MLGLGGGGRWEEVGRGRSSSPYLPLGVVEGAREDLALSWPRKIRDPLWAGMDGRRHGIPRLGDAAAGGGNVAHRGLTPIGALRGAQPLRERGECGCGRVSVCDTGPTWSTWGPGDVGERGASSFLWSPSLPPSWTFCSCAVFIMEALVA